MKQKELIYILWHPRETLENPGHSRDNAPVIAGQDLG